jgi:hypothetical protein
MLGFGVNSRGLTTRRREHVTLAANRQDNLRRVRRIGEFATQVDDVHIDGAGRRIASRQSPNAFEDLGARDGAATIYRNSSVSRSDNCTRLLSGRSISRRSKSIARPATSTLVTSLGRSALRRSTAPTRANNSLLENGLTT